MNIAECMAIQGAEMILEEFETTLLKKKVVTINELKELEEMAKEIQKDHMIQCKLLRRC